MNSKTKFEITPNQLNAIFENAKLGRVESFKPLGKGMYNAVYKVEAGGKRFAIKIAPPPDIRVMTYEKDMLATEVAWYKLMREKTEIRVPEILAVDMSRKIIPADYFIMEYVEGTTADKLDKTEEEKILVKTSLCRNVAELHAVKSEKFGYVQNKLYDNWYDALKSFVTNCLEDLKALGKRSKRGEKLLEYVVKHEELLRGVKGTLVNYDAWDLNIIAKRTKDGLELTWIDPERGFYGDPIFDFICIEPMKMSLYGKSESVKIYNSFADEKVTLSHQEEIRFAFAMGYMALIQETEKFYRFKRTDIGWWYDVFSSGFYYPQCFKRLKKV